MVSLQDAEVYDQYCLSLTNLSVLLLFLFLCHIVEISRFITFVFYEFRIFTPPKYYISRSATKISFFLT